MDAELTFRTLSDEELDLVGAGRGWARSRSPMSSSLVGEVSIGEIIVYAYGNSTVTIDVIGVNSTVGAAATNAMSAPGRAMHQSWRG